jgi:hypothetical protein
MIAAVVLFAIYCMVMKGKPRLHMDMILPSFGMFAIILIAKRGRGQRALTR